MRTISILRRKNSIIFPLSCSILFQATSSLDTETEQSIQDSLISLGIHRTVVIIAHRLTTVQNADLIIVLENGKVVEQGTHVELLSKSGGRYAELVMKMMQT